MSDPLTASDFLATDSKTAARRARAPGKGELHDFAERGDLEAVRRDSGVPVDALDQTDQTALHGAAAFGHTEVLRLLL
ncbi:MAG TPA: ankyrin repeat domain-containing protein [Polyangiaceae bacterium]|nr:ankyrin repeat domain-containing protein [Polyangiaceae bacterium]